MIVAPAIVMKVVLGSVLMNTSKCFWMFINVELGLVLCKVCLCLKTCSVKVKAGIQGVLMPGLWLLPRHSQHIHHVVNSVSYGLVYIPHPLLEWVRCLFMKFTSSATLTPTWRGCLIRERLMPILSQ